MFILLYLYKHLYKYVVGLSLLSSVSAFGPCPGGGGTGYSKWSDLKGALESSPLFGGVYVICPDTTLDVSTAGPIEFETSGVTIQCGQDGNGAGCLIDGGKAPDLGGGQPTLQ